MLLFKATYNALKYISIFFGNGTHDDIDVVYAIKVQNN